MQGKADTAGLEIVNGQVGAQEAVTEDIKVETFECRDAYDALVKIFFAEIECVVFEGHTEIIACPTELYVNIIYFTS